MQPKCLLLATTLFLLWQPGQAATHYVSPTGSDANEGSRDRPWEHPGWATRQLSPGDTLILLPGVYVLREFDGDILRPPSGTPQAWTAVRGAAGARPVLAGRDNLLTAVDLSGRHHVLLENLEITHDPNADRESAWFRDGLEVLGQPSSHLILRGLVVHHLDEFGMNLQDVEAVEISGCRISHCGFGALGGPAGEHGGWRNVTVRACTLSWSGHYYRGGNGQDRPYDRPDGLGTERSDGPLLIEDTVAEHNCGDGLDSKTARTTIRRCVVANNRCDGVKLWADSSVVLNTLIYGRGDGDPQPTPWAALVIDQVEQAGAHFEITNVTIDDSLGHGYLAYVQYENPIPLDIRFRNCIFSARGPDSPIYVHGATHLRMDYCLFHFPRSVSLVTHGDRSIGCADLDTLGYGNLCADPRFVRTAWGTEGNYHLLPGSPAIDAGDPAPAWNDADGTRNDLGAYGGPGALPTSAVSHEQTPKHWPTRFALLAVQPNPARDRISLRFSLTSAATVQVTIYDLLGRPVYGPKVRRLRRGFHEFPLHVATLPAGVYVLRLRAGSVSATGKFCVVR